MSQDMTLFLDVLFELAVLGEEVPPLAVRLEPRPLVARYRAREPGKDPSHLRVLGGPPALARGREPRPVGLYKHVSYDLGRDDVHEGLLGLQVDKRVEKARMKERLMRLAHVPPAVCSQGPGLDLQHRPHAQYGAEHDDVGRV